MCAAITLSMTYGIFMVCGNSLDVWNFYGTEAKSDHFESNENSQIKSLISLYVQEQNSGIFHCKHISPYLSPGILRNSVAISSRSNALLTGLVQSPSGTNLLNQGRPAIGGGGSSEAVRTIT